MKVAVLIPAYNASKTLAGVIKRIPRQVVDDVIVVNDGSSDGTHEVLAGFDDLRIVTHEKNRGYGAAQISLYEAASAARAEIVVILHADGGHFPEEIPALIQPVRSGRAEVVCGDRIRGIEDVARPFLGSRVMGAALHSPMPAHRFLGHKIVNALTNTLMSTNYGSFHSGFRACTRAVLEQMEFRKFVNGYLFDMQFLLEAHRRGFRIVEVPVTSYYDPDSGSSASVIKIGCQVLMFLAQKLISDRRPGLA